MNDATHIDVNLPKSQDNGLRLLFIPSQTTNPEQIQGLAQLLKNTKIDLSINGDLDNSHAIAEQILQYHPAAVQLQVSREDFPQLWQQTINARKQANTTQLLTGLVVACDRVIEQFLGQILGINDDQLWRLHLHPGTLSIVYYPNSEHPPILQAMNLDPSS
jgi:probable phosphoglycerate mutase